MFGTHKQDVPFVSSVSMGLIDFSDSGAEAANVLGSLNLKATEYLQMLTEGVGNALLKLPESARGQSPRQRSVTCFVLPRTEIEIAVADQLKKAGAHLRLLLPRSVSQMPEAVRNWCSQSDVATVAIEVEDGDLNAAEKGEVTTQLQETLIRQSDLLLVLVGAKNAEAEQAITVAVARESRVFPVIMLPVEDLKKAKLLLYGAGPVQVYQDLSPEIKKWLQRFLQLNGKHFKNWEPGFSFGGIYQWLFSLLLRSKPAAGPFWIRNFAGKTKMALQLPDGVLATMEPANRRLWEEFSQQYGKDYIWADLLGIYFGNRFRLQIVRTIFFSTVAALVVLWMLFTGKLSSALLLTEGISLLVVLLTVVLMSVRKEKQNWIDYRLLAEFLRPMPYLASIVRRFRPSIRDVAVEATEQDRTWWQQTNAGNSRVLWQYESILRGVEIPSIKVNRSYLTDVKQALVQLAQAQITWHRSNEEKHLKVHGFLHRFTVLVFLGGLTISILHATTAFPQLSGKEPPNFGFLLLFVAGSLGVFGSALGATISYFGFAEIAERSGSARWHFERLQREMEGDRGLPTLRQVTEWANELSRVMAEEQVDWYNQMSRISVHLG